MGNPPFIGAKHLRDALGDGYAEALRKTWPEVPESADFVMHWWSRAALLVTSGKTRRFGLITTNSLRQTFNRRVVQAALDKGLALTFAIPDHPWVDSRPPVGRQRQRRSRAHCHDSGRTQRRTQNQSG
ncbi:MAG: hypothetical protein EAZ34_08125 [Polaromonas sp.]|nr:MAG: hypothetical protein EAZ34_08125 [Polaromonas sp.]